MTMSNSSHPSASTGNSSMKSRSSPLHAGRGPSLIKRRNGCIHCWVKRQRGYRSGGSGPDRNGTWWFECEGFFCELKALALVLSDWLPPLSFFTAFQTPTCWHRFNRSSATKRCRWFPIQYSSIFIFQSYLPSDKAIRRIS